MRWWELSPRVQPVKSLCVQCGCVAHSKRTHDTWNKSSLWGIREIKLSVKEAETEKHGWSYAFIVSQIVFIYVVVHKFVFLLFTFVFTLLCHSLSELKSRAVSLVWWIYLFELLLLDLASVFLSIPPSPSFLMNDSDVFLPEAPGKTSVCCLHHTAILNQKNKVHPSHSCWFCFFLFMFFISNAWEHIQY